MGKMTREDLVKKVVTTYEQLKNEWAKKNVEACRKSLGEVKVELTKLQFLPSRGQGVSKEELLVARSILEIGALWSIAVKDIPSFERYISMLKMYYMDYKEMLPESSYMYELLGLDLLCLLAQNKVGEFHTALEHLPTIAVTDNVYIRHPVAMEQYLMEGAYNKIYLAKGEVPAEGYKFFIEELLSTIREDIGKMLYLSSTKEILQYCEQRGWKVESDGYLHFKKEVRKSDDTIPSQELAHQMINYAREMEQIV